MNEQERSVKAKIILGNALGYISAICFGIMLMASMDAIEKSDNIERITFYALISGLCLAATVAAIIRTLRPL